MKRYFKVNVLLLIIILLFSYCSQSQNDLTYKEIKVGVFDLYPNLYIDDKGRAKGLLIEILEEVAKQENFKIIYVKGNYSDLLRKLHNEEIDILPNVAYKETFGTSILLNKYPILSYRLEVIDNSISNLSTLEQISNLKIGVVENSFQENKFNSIIIANKYSDYNITTFTNRALLIEALNSLEVDVIVEDKSIYFSEVYAKNNLYPTNIIIENGSLHFAFNINNSNLLETIDMHLKNMLADNKSLLNKLLNNKKLKYDAGFLFLKYDYLKVLIVLSLILIVIIIIFIYILKRKHKHEILKNKELNTLNTQLININNNLETTNLKLFEANEYINDVTNSLQIGLYRIIVFENKELDKYGMQPQKFVYVNDVFLKITELNQVAILSDAFELINTIHPDYRDSFITENINVPAVASEFLWEGKLLVNSKEKWVKFNSVKRRINEDETIWTGTLSDITNEKLSEIKLKKTEISLNTITEISPSGIFITDSKGKTLYVNPNWLNLSGLSYDEALGDGWISAIHPEDIDQLNKVWNSCISQKISGNANYRFLHKNGNIVWVTSFVVPQIIDSEVVGFIGTTTDITLLKENETLLLLSEKKYKRIAENIGDVVWISDLNLNVKYVSSSIISLTGETVEEHLKKTLYEKISPESIKVIQKCYYEELANEQDQNINRNRTRTIELEHYKKDGTLIWVSMNLTFVRNSEGKPIEILGVTRDIDNLKNTEKKLIEAKEKAEESDKLKSAFLANMSHEIRTPMNGILGFSELLKKPNLSEETIFKYSDIINKSGERMLNIINDIIDISKIESNQMEINISSVKVNKQLQELHNFFKLEAEKKGLLLKYIKNITIQNVELETDADKLFAILSNLLKNAIKFTDKGSIEFGYFYEENYLHFFVRDTGVGIEKDKISLIFKRFVQGSNKYSRNYEGSGLGLYISKSFVEMLGGKIWVESVYGTGSTFHFSLPFAKNLEELNQNRKDVDFDVDIYNINIELKKLKILICDDEEISAILLYQLLNKYSFEIIFAKNGQQGVEEAQKHIDVDLILMDLKMPILDGIEATKQIRQFNQKVVIIAQSAFAMLGDDKKAIEAGCNAYITKPINYEKLTQLIYYYFYSDHISKD